MALEVAGSNPVIHPEESCNAGLFFLGTAHCLHFKSYSQFDPKSTRSLATLREAMDKPFHFRVSLTRLMIYK